MTHTGPSPLQELELVEDVWRGEAQDLLSQIAQLQEENKQLMTNLSHKDVSFSEEEFQKHEGKRRGWLGRWGERLFPSSSPASPVSPEDGPERRVSCHVPLHHHMPGVRARSCPTLRDPMDCSPPGSSVHGISQAGILEWVAIFSFRGSCQTRDQACVSCIVRWVIYRCATGEAVPTITLPERNCVVWFTGDETEQFI